MKGFAGYIAIVVLVLGGCRQPEVPVQLARTWYEEGRVIEAEALLRPLFERPSQPDSVALFYAEVLLARGELLRARPLLAALAADPGPLQTTALRHHAHTQFFLGHPDTSATLARRLLTLAQQQHDTLRIAQAYHLLGLVGFYEAAYDSAQWFQEESLRLARHSGNLKAEADALRQLGVLAWYRGHLDEALTAYYQPALEHYRRLRDRIGEATTLSNIGLLHPQNAEANLRHQLMAFDIRKRIGDQIGLSDSYYFLGNNPYIHHPGISTGGQTYTYYKKSLQISTRIGYAWGREVSLRSLNGLQNRAWDGARVRHMNRWTDSLTTVSGEGHHYVQYQAALNAYLASDWEETINQCRRLYRLGDSLQVAQIKFQALGWQILPLKKLGRWQELRDVLDQLARQHLPDRRQGGMEAEYWLDTGQLQRAEAELRPLVDDYDARYLKALYETDAGIAFERAAGATFALRSDLYLTLVKALVRQHKLDEAFTFIERERLLPFWGGQEEAPARQAVSDFIHLLDAYDADPAHFEDVQELLTAVSEMQQAMLAEQTVLSQAALLMQESQASLQPTSLMALQQSLEPDEVFIEYIMGRVPDAVFPTGDATALHLLVVRRDTVTAIPVEGDPRAIDTAIDVYRRALLRGQDHPGDTVWQGMARRLYQLLLAPARGLFYPGDRLILSPHRSLHLIPFHALVHSASGESVRFVVQDHVVSYVASATALVQARHQAVVPMQSLLAVVPDSRSLPFAAQEVQAIPSDLFAQKQTRKNRAAQAGRVLEEMEAYDVIHLAAHARMNPRFPLYSYLALSDRRLELHEVLQQRLRARLVVLSACETGQGMGAFGTIPSSEDLISFPRAFLTAGAASVLSSMWLVEDKATASLMEKFYQQLASTQQPFKPAALDQPGGLAASLAQAQRTWIAEAHSGSRPDHPFFWASFYLIGDGR